MQNPDCCVAKIKVSAVRDIKSIEVTDEALKKLGHSTYGIDVISRPIGKGESVPENIAHCQIEVSPTVITGSRFGKIKESLAYIVNESKNRWALPPT